MKKILSVLLLVSCLGYEITITQPAASKAEIVGNWKKIDNADYLIRYPASWSLEQKEQASPENYIKIPFIIFSPLESPQDKFRENINLVIEDLQGRTIDGVDGSKINLDQYAVMSVGQLQAQMKNYKSIETKKVTTGRREYYKTIFTWDSDPHHLKVEQYYWITKGKAYVLTFTAEQPKFAKFRKVGESILNSFVLKNN
jgi:hypothetical protein